MEAISRKKEVDEMSKTLAKEFDSLQVDFDGVNYSLSAGIANSGWRQIFPNLGVFVNSTYFDLAGMTLEEKTLFFEGAAMQEVLNPQFTPASPGDGMIVVDIMSQIPLTDAEVNNFKISGNLATSPSSTLTFDQTIYGRIRYMNVDLDNQAGSFTITVSDNQLGSLSPTASDRIYCYRYVTIAQGAPGISTLFGARYLLRAESKEEAEYQYLMRLKRSYELQNEPDRD
ncbi:MAG: hypothetical protein ACYTE5_12625 [Planctomycetota bacterium]